MSQTEPSQDEVRELFFRCVAMETAACDALLKDTHGRSPAVSAAVRKMLLDQQQMAFLDEPPTLLADAEAWGKPEMIDGRYQVIRQIGEGGFAIVYAAQQIEPIRREVALKVIKPGMDSREVIRRFEAERQTLAMMDHPHVAKALDAGTTAAGRPFFIMELVRGSSITQYCDDNGLGTRQRLELFVEVCHAVQHAHLKGIIHRDLKPSNVLVAEDGEKPAPKVIDFGVAKALGQELHRDQELTMDGQIVGTPLYMSPEQAMLNQDIDTRSDVYSLGALLYELLTGCTPVDRESLRTLGLDEVRRLIREVDPPRPSIYVGALQANALSTLSAHRSCDTRRLSHSLQGELDWIVMKALEKDRDRRYESPSALAADIGRHFRGEAVAAGPPSIVYEWNKFASRNWLPLLSCSAIAIALAAGATIAAWQAQLVREANKALSKSYAQAQTASTMLAGEVQAKEHALEQSRSSLDQALEAVNSMYLKVGESWVTDDVMLSQTQRTLLEDAAVFYEKVLRQPSAYNADRDQLLKLAFRMGSIHQRLGQHAAAADKYQLGVRIIDASGPLDQASRFQRLQLQREISRCATELGKYTEARRGIESVIAELDQIREDASSEPPLSQFREGCVLDLAKVNLSVGNGAAAERQLRPLYDAIGRGDVLERQVRIDIEQQLARSLLAQGQYDAAEPMLRRALGRCRSALINSTDSHPLREAELSLLDDQLLLYICTNRPEQALAHAEESLERQLTLLPAHEAPDLYDLREFLDPAQHPQVDRPIAFSRWVRTMSLLAVVQHQLGRPLAAEQTLGRASVLATVHRFNHPSLRCRADLCNVYGLTGFLLKEGHPDEAQSHAQLAAQGWLEAAVENEEALEHQSGICFSPESGIQTDYITFITEFPDWDIRGPAAQSPLERQPKAPSVPAMRARAWLWIQVEQWEQALNFCNQVLSLRSPNDPHANYLATICLAKLGRLDDAAKAFETAARPKPEEPLIISLRTLAAASIQAFEEKSPETEPGDK